MPICYERKGSCENLTAQSPPWPLPARRSTHGLSQKPIASELCRVTTVQPCDASRLSTRTRHNPERGIMTNFMKVLADNKLDAIVYKSVEHQPTLIKDGVNPPFVNTKGVPHLNTFLVFVPAIAVPAGFTADNLPAGITFMGRPYEEGTMLKLAYGYEQATHHRKPPQSTPALPGEP